MAQNILGLVHRLMDDSGAIEPNATIEVYLAGTSTPCVLYVDRSLGTSAGYIMTADAAGVVPERWIADSTLIKLVYRDADGAVKHTRDYANDAPPHDLPFDLEAVRVCATYAAMIALPADELQAGAAFYVLDRATEGDGGGGMFEGFEGTGGDDGGTVLDHASLDFQFKRKNIDAFNPRWFGAVAGDTGNQASTFTSTIAAGVETYVPAGIYRHSSPILITDQTDGRKIRGSNRYRSILRRTPATDTSAQVAITTTGVEIEDMGFDGSYDPPTYAPASTNAAILLNNANGTVDALRGGRVRRVRFTNQQAGGVFLTGGNQGLHDIELDDIECDACPRYGAITIFKGVVGLKVGSVNVSDGGAAFGSDDGTASDDIVYPTAITQANPAVITMTAHGMVNVPGLSKYLKFSGIGGMTQLNGNAYLATVLDANTISIAVDSTGFSAFTSGGMGTTLRPNINGRIRSLHATNCGHSTIGPGEAVSGHSGMQDYIWDEVILEDCCFDDPNDPSTFTGNYGMLFNSGQDGIHRCQDITIKRLIDRRSSNLTIVLAGVKNFTIEELVVENTWRRASDPGGTKPVIRLIDDELGNSCENVRILHATMVKNDPKSFGSCFLENQCAAATGIYVNWNAVSLPSGVLPYVNTGGITFTEEYVPPYARGMLFGLTLSNNGSDANNDIDIAAGRCVDGDNADFLALNATMTKRGDAAWAVGSGNGGGDTGAIANGVNYVWLIKRPDTGVVDVLFSASATAPTMPSNYTLKRRIGAFIKTSGVNEAFVQRGNKFLLKNPIGISGATVGTSRSLITTSAPPNMTALMRLYGVNSGAAVNIIIHATFETDSAPSAGSAPGLNLRGEVAAQGMAENYEIEVDSNSQFAARASVASSSVLGVTYGWIDRRGRDG